ncbi:MAG: hypothetical protein J6R98_05275, partial [Bacteroidaceae bacterium]|nr:hypothetical protein [Bacteroidaceae bacterium]
SIHPMRKKDKDARHIYEVLVENESMISRQLKKASGFSLSRKRTSFNPKDPMRPIENPKNGTAFDALIADLEMGTHICIADFEYLISKKGEPYGWGLARYCTPEAMYPDLFPSRKRWKDVRPGNPGNAFSTICAKCCQTQIPKRLKR